MTSFKRFRTISLALITAIMLSMGLFALMPQAQAQTPTTITAFHKPYKDSATNLIYNLLFGDDLGLFKTFAQAPEIYPYNELFAAGSSTADLQKVLDDQKIDPRLRVLAANRLLSLGHKPAGKVLLAVIVEVGMEEGLDVLASFPNGTARYINHTGKMIVWEANDDARINELTTDLFAKSREIVNQIGPYDKPREPQPATGNTRITFLVSDGLYFGEATTEALFGDGLAGPALAGATQLMQYMTEKSSD